MSWPDLGAVPPDWASLRRRRDPARELDLVVVELAGALLPRVPERLLPERLYGVDESVARFALLDGPAPVGEAVQAVGTYVTRAAANVDLAAREGDLGDENEARFAVALLHLLTTARTVSGWDGSGLPGRARSWLSAVREGLPRYEMGYDIARRATAAAWAAGLTDVAATLWPAAVAARAAWDRTAPPPEVAAVLAGDATSDAWPGLVAAFPALLDRNELSWAELFAAGMAVHRGADDVAAAIRSDLP